jgi:hypothetical protein
LPVVCFQQPLTVSAVIAGEFDKAVQWQTKAIDLAPDSQKADFQTRSDQYRDGKPYRQEKK